MQADKPFFCDILEWRVSQMMVPQAAQLGQLERRGWRSISKIWGEEFLRHANKSNNHEEKKKMNRSKTE